MLRKKNYNNINISNFNMFMFPKKITLLNKN